jgi:signal transduction histidine kinase
MNFGRSSSMRAPRRWWVLIICLGIFWAPVRGAQAAASKRVLILYSGHKEFPFNALIDPTIKSSLKSASDTPLEFFSEYLDTERFSQDAYAELIRNYYKEKYSINPPDVVLAFRDPAIDFLVKHGNEVFPGVPGVFFSYNQSRLSGENMRPGLTGAVVTFDFGATLKLALKLHPNTNQVMVVSGTANVDRDVAAIARDQFRGYDERLKFTYLAGLTPQELQEKLANLPDGAITIYLSVNKDRTGQVHIAVDVLRLIASSTNRPIYGVAETYLDNGAVGGFMLSVDEVGKMMGSQAALILQGTKPGDVPISSKAFARYMFDWRQLQRWGVSEAQLPPGHLIKNKPLSPWDYYRWHIIIVGCFIALESLLVVTLLVQRSRRLKAEEDLKASVDEMRQLYLRFANVEDDERRALHTELHDQVGANLSAMRIELDVIASLVARSESANALGHLKSAREVAIETSAMARDLMAELRPPALDDYGLVAALRTFAESQATRLSLAIEVAGQDLLPRPSRMVEGALFRIAHEALMNSARHASAKRVTLAVVARAGHVVLTIEDDGAGFDLNAPGVGPDHWGLKNMRERAWGIGGTLRIDTAPGAGTRITAEAPREPS